MHLGSIEVMKRFVAIGLGLALGPRVTMVNEVRASQVVAVPIHPLESAKAFVGEYVGFRWFGASHLPINRGNNRGYNTGVDTHRHRIEGTHRRKAWERSNYTDRAQYSTH